DDTRRYLETPLPELAERIPALNQQAARSIDGILSPEQRIRLASMVGESASVVEDAVETSGRPGTAPAQAAAPPVLSAREPAGRRRLAYAVRYGSAEDLGALVGERFPGEVDNMATADPAGAGAWQAPAASPGDAASGLSPLNNVLMLSVKPSALDRV